MVHGIEDVLVHGVDIQTLFLAECGQLVHENREVHIEFINIRQHDHGKILLEHALGYVHDIGVAFGTGRGDARNDADAVLARYGDHGFHGFGFLLGFRYAPGSSGRCAEGIRISILLYYIIAKESIGK